MDESQAGGRDHRDQRVLQTTANSPRRKETGVDLRREKWSERPADASGRAEHPAASNGQEDTYLYRQLKSSGRRRLFAPRSAPPGVRFGAARFSLRHYGEWRFAPGSPAVGEATEARATRGAHR